MSSNPAVAIVYHFFALYRQPVLTALLSADDLRVTLVADRKNRIMPGVPEWDVPPDVRFQEARCVPLPGGLMWQRGLLGLPFRRELDAIVYLGNWRWPATWISAMLARLAGKRVLFWTHGWRKPARGLNRILLNIFYRIPHGLLLYGNRAREIAIENGFDPRRLYVVFNSLDHRLHQRLRESISPAENRQTRLELFGDAETPIVICSSRISKRKRLGLLLIAAAELKRRGRPVNVILIGDGPERSSLTRLAEELGVRVHFAGACFDETTIARYTLASSVTVSPGATGLTVVQSLVYGRPILTGDAFEEHGPEIEAIVPGVTGDFFHADDPGELADMIAAYTQPDSPDASRQASCRRVVDLFYNPDYQVSVFRQAIGGQAAEPVSIHDAVAAEPIRSPAESPGQPPAD
jgi:glycosyltransferase involved in cell wall biosynthesis